MTIPQARAMAHEVHATCLESGPGSKADHRRTFEEWLHAPIDSAQPDERYEIRRAAPEVFPQIYRLVDTVFERRRSRQAYDWLYLHNPEGLARCSYVVERSSGEIVSCVTGFPWPIARGHERCNGVMGGDAVTLQRLQRQGLSEMRRQYNEGHPFYDITLSLGIPNFKSRAAAKKYNRNQPFGPLPMATLVLDWASYLRDHRVPGVLAAPAGLTGDSAQRLWQALRIRRGAAFRTEELGRFDSAADAVTHRWMHSASYWCPHSAEFLNWRYFSNPLASHSALALRRGDDLAGYGVVQTEGRRALLMEFVAPPDLDGAAETLLAGIVSTARSAGCDRIDFYATTGWRFWGLLRRAGFTSRKSSVYVTSRLTGHDEVCLEENWQLLPGDSDVT